ncbi:MAG: fumarylacetoacetate hydrolase family protein [Hyphomonadaceae bacterium]|nr:fumarylacetoacetate hydrolase family protein [Hyphomonadaceae bacterium]
MASAPASLGDPKNSVAAQFVAARLAARPLPAFPGPIPTTLQRAYAHQEEAIGLWPDAIAAWKIGRIPARQGHLAAGDRLAGPIFRRAIREARGDETIAIPILVGGFAAVEGELALECAQDAPADKTAWSREEALAMIGRARIAVEIAGSPLASINDLGATVVVSDFGNNFGLVLGDDIPDWRDAIETIGCETSINGDVVGAGDARSLMGGPLESFRFLLEHLPTRGRRLRAGDIVSTGALSGVHDIRFGQSAQCHFGPHGVIRCRAVAATAMAQ